MTLHPGGPPVTGERSWVMNTLYAHPDLADTIEAVSDEHAAALATLGWYPADEDPPAADLGDDDATTVLPSVVLPVTLVDPPTLGRTVADTQAQYETLVSAGWLVENDDLDDDTDTELPPPPADDPVDTTED